MTSETCQGWVVVRKSDWSILPSTFRAYRDACEIVAPLDDAGEDVHSDYAIVRAEMTIRTV